MRLLLLFHVGLFSSLCQNVLVVVFADSRSISSTDFHDTGTYDALPGPAVKFSFIVV